MSSAEPVKRGRGRPPKSQGEIDARRREIVEAAYELFAERGYHATAMTDIARSLDVAQGTLYLTFKNKREVLDHVLDYVLEQALSPVMEGVGDPPTTAGEFRAQVSALGHSLFNDVLDRDPRLLRMVMLDLSAVDDELLARAVGVVSSIEVVLAGYLGQAADQGYLAPGLDVPSVARAVVGCCMAAVVASVRAPIEPSQRDAYINTIVLMVCGPE